MKRLAAFVFAFLAVCYIQAADAQFVRECRYGFCHGGGLQGGPVSNACINSSGTTITFTAQGTGGPNPRRISVVSINWSDSTAAGTAQLNSLTIGGITMSRAVSTTSGVTNSNSEIWYVANPTGTSSNIVATFATAVDGVTIEVYSLIGYQGLVATTTGTITASQTYSNKQLAIAAGSRTTNVSTSLSSMVNDFSSACGSGLWGVHASQRLNGNNQTLTTNLSPTTSNPKIAMAVWAVTPLTNPVTSKVLWVDAQVTASISLSGADVTGWADQSGNGNNLVPVGSGNRTHYSATSINGAYPGIAFTATDLAGLGKTSLALGTGNTLTLWYVGTLAEALSATSGRFWSYSDGVHDDFNFAGNFTAGTSNPVNQTSFVWNRNSISVSGNATATPTIHTVIITVSSGGVQTLYIDGVAISTSTSAGNWVSPGSFSLGRDSFTDSSYVSMHVGEFGLATSFSNSTTVAALNAYLTTKWGLTPAPLLSGQFFGPTGTSTGAVTVSTNYTSTPISYIVTTNSSTPTNSQIIAGLDAGGSAATYASTIASPVAVPSFNHAATVTGLSASTNYYAYFAQGPSSNVVSSGPIQTFSPSSLTGLIGWWDTSVTASLTLSGSNITAIADQSGAGNNLASTGCNPPYSATGFNTSFPAVVFASASHCGLEKTSFAIGTGNTLTAWYVGTLSDGSVSLARLLSYAAGGGNFDWNNAGSFFVGVPGATTNQIQFFRNSTGVNATSTTGNHTVIATVNAGAIVVYVDGVSAATGTITGNWISGGTFRFGMEASAAASWWGGPVGEAGIATGFANSTTAGNLHNYLRAKWGL